MLFSFPKKLTLWKKGYKKYKPNIKWKNPKNHGILFARKIIEKPSNTKIVFIAILYLSGTERLFRMIDTIATNTATFIWKILSIIYL